MFCSRKHRLNITTQRRKLESYPSAALLKGIDDFICKSNVCKDGIVLFAHILAETIYKVEQYICYYYLFHALFIYFNQG